MNHLPDEVLLDIFDFYRRGTDLYDYKWRGEYRWFNLAHVCRKWRAVMFASTSRLDLGITVGAITPGDIETLLSGRWPIFINYYWGDLDGDLTDSALWRLRAALKQPDRVRDISFAGPSQWFDEVFPTTNIPFPKLEGLVLRPFYNDELKLPDTFLGGAHLSHLHLRRLELQGISLASVYRFLWSTPALTDLDLKIDTAFGTSPETSLLACLQGMPSLCRLDLVISSGRLESPPQPPTLKDIVPLSQLTWFRYVGQSVFLDAIAAGISAPFLQDLRMEFLDEISSPNAHLLHLPRFINEKKEHYHTLHLTLLNGLLRLMVLTDSEFTNDDCHNWLRFKSCPVQGLPMEIMRMGDALSTKLAAVEELRISIFGTEDDDILFHRFYRQFSSAKLFRIAGINYNRIARTLLQGHLVHADGCAFFPALEEIELGRDEFWREESQTKYELGAFDSFIFARQEAGRPVKVYFSSSPF
jgi:hypothetical protein